MKCLSLWQPWASLIALGAKRCETRSWETLYRGPMAIHAAKKWTRELADLCLTDPFYGRLRQICQHPAYYRSGDALPLGAIVAIARVADCVRITPDNAPGGDEYSFGDYAPGRFRWDLADIQPLVSPIPYRGAQGLFDVPDDLIRAALAQKERARRVLAGREPRP